MGLAVSIYRLLARAYPSRFSGRYAEEMVDLFADQLRDAELEGRVVRFWFRTIKDWLRSVPAEHVEEFRHRAASNAANSGNAVSTSTVVRRVLVFSPNVAVALFVLAGIFGHRAFRKLRS